MSTSSLVIPGSTDACLIHLVGTILPLGTRVRIDEVRKNRVVFKPESAPLLTLFFKGLEGYLSFDRYLERVFIADDPGPKLRNVAPRTARLLPP